MRALHCLALATAGLLLAGCQSLLTPAQQPLPTSTQRWEHRPTGCTAPDCPLVNIDLQLPKGLPELNARIERELLQLTTELPSDPPPASLQGYERDFLATAKPGWTSYLQAKVLQQHGRVVVIELSSYRFTGGAHGIPGRSYLNYDRTLNKVLTLNDMLLPDQEGAFWDQVQLAHQAWLKANGYDQDAEFLDTWPFERSDNIALLFGNVMLKYDIARIAPYSSGHPDLRVPYPRLNGILQPYYFPGRR